MDNTEDNFVTECLIKILTFLNQYVKKNQLEVVVY